MLHKIKIGSSFSYAPAHLSSPYQTNAQRFFTSLSLFGEARKSRNLKAIKPCLLTHGWLTSYEISSRKPTTLLATAEDQEPSSQIKMDDFELEKLLPSGEDASSTGTFYSSDTGGAGGKPGFISFYSHTNRSQDQALVKTERNESFLLWFGGPTFLVASFIFPSLYLRRILSTIFEDSLLTDFLILFFTETLFYVGIAVFLLMIDRLSIPAEPVSASTKQNLAPHLGHRISSVAVLVLSIIVPMVTMGLVWPWTGPAASAALAPYLVGIVVQFAFEQYARRSNSPSWPAIPVIFQVYRLHQLNRATQLVTALSFTIRGAEMTSQNLAINSSLSTLLNVLRLLGVMCIWSLSSFIMRYFQSRC